MSELAPSKHEMSDKTKAPSESSQPSDVEVGHTHSAVAAGDDNLLEEIGYKQVSESRQNAARV